MFTGLIEEVGKVQSASLQGGNLTLEVKAPKLSPDIRIGDSVNIDGVCQTAVEVKSDRFTVNTISETLRKTNLGDLKNGDSVNLELALRTDSRMGGHLVSGHIDCRGKTKTIRKIEGSWELAIGYPVEFDNLVVPKGSIAINGVSLTVTHSDPGLFGVSIIPHTWGMTNFPSLKPGDSVNLEFDLIGKYIQQMINPYKAREGNVDLETFRRAGF
ncbi:MAG: riboflavin synthase [candidate division Zixibacteria bacterium]|nr:riboflavin synthase [candidate division Zixibacteria bacterium]NIR65859.1 riboflavin synthase [candidate division Zixibacteria bacterium]NIS16497.1 riboflavin synthase [candidate division Zixibacteria bacterium]NIS47513.1 riboflavin synthase [candidate division Zixibacteria bacterium]NIT52870.1 riboflavin synthase [candidate division Zixibacteria bacterium]